MPDTNHETTDLDLAPLDLDPNAVDLTPEEWEEIRKDLAELVNDAD